MKGLVICVCKNIQIGDVSRVSLLIYNLDCNALSSIWKDFSQGILSKHYFLNLGNLLLNTNFKTEIHIIFFFPQTY